MTLRFNKHIVMALVIAIYTIAFILTFERLYDSIQISSIGLIGLVVWFYWMRAGFVAIPGFILLNTLVLWRVSGKPEDILLTYNPLGILLSAAMVSITGLMKNSTVRLKHLRATLSQRVTEETRELETRVSQLLAFDETERVRIGQDLHDGIGQLLAGMLLRSEALWEQLAALGRPEAGQAANIRDRIQKDIYSIRALSRALLPVHLGQYGFEAALAELVENCIENSGIDFHLDIDPSVDRRLADSAALHLYRIIQEIISCLQEDMRPERIRINISFAHETGSVYIECQAAEPFNGNACISKILEYRIRAIEGRLTQDSIADSGLRLCLEFPASMEGAKI
jgi:signal transduction histidine kinase